MTYLVASLGSGKGTWAHLSKLIATQDWNKIFFVTSSAYEGKFPLEAEHEYIVIDMEKPMKDLASDIKQSLDGKIADTEVALSIVSGTGKEHMAILAALLKLGIGIRLVAYTNLGVDEL